MSANLLQHPGKLNTFTDDLESFLHVLTWTALRYLPAVYSYLHVDFDIGMFDEHYWEQGRSPLGGEGKARAFRAGQYPSSAFQPRRKTPLSDLLTDLSSPFKLLYAEQPPTPNDLEKINVPISKHDQDLEDLSWDIHRCDRDIEQLQSSSWFINQIQTALDRQDWPTDDRADEWLPLGRKMMADFPPGRVIYY